MIDTDWNPFERLIKQYLSNYGKRYEHSHVDFLWKELRFHDLGVIESGLRAFSENEGNKHFPNIGQLKASIHNFLNMHKDHLAIDDKEVPCDRCLGKGWHEATYQLFNVVYKAAFRCPCPNGNRNPELTIMPRDRVNKIVDTPLGPIKKIVQYIPVIPEDKYSSEVVTQENMKLEVKSV